MLCEDPTPEPFGGSLTAGVLGAVGLFKVVLCFAFYSPTEGAFCWVGDGGQAGEKEGGGSAQRLGPSKPEEVQGGPGSCPTPVGLKGPVQ